MKLIVYDGGLLKKQDDLTAKEKADKIKNLRLHFTTIESNMAGVTQQAKVLGWEELNEKVIKAKDYINGILKYIKDREKRYNLVDKKKPSDKKVNPFQLVTEDFEEDIDFIEG